MLPESVKSCEQCKIYEDPGIGTLDEIGAHWRANHPEELENIKAALALFQAQQHGAAWASMKVQILGG